MIDFICDLIKEVYGLAKSKLEKSYLLIKNEGFSSRFTRLLIVFISIGASAFGTVGLLVLMFYLGNDWLWKPLYKITVDLLGILASIFHAENTGDLMVRAFIVFHLPVVILIVIQKIITKNLIKKYRDKESNLIKP
jgi:uncharacterized membrane protein